MLDEVADEVAAVARKGDVPNIEGEIGNKLYRMSSRATSSLLWGKQPGFLSPYVKVSPTARRLQVAIAPEFAKQWTGIQERIPASLFETYKSYNGNWLTRYYQIVEPLAKKSARQKASGLLDSETNDLIHKAMRGGRTGNKEANIIGMNLRELYSDIGSKLESLGLIHKKVPNYVHRMWHRQHILDNEQKFKELLVSQGQSETLEQADEVFKSMMNKANQLDSSEAQGHFFNKRRILNNIRDESAFTEFFEQDVRITMAHYIHQASKSIAKKEVLGVRDLKEFQDYVRTPIINEIREAAGNTLSKKEYQSIVHNIDNLYKSVTSAG
jgi:RNA processing factor Prp31